MHLAPYVFWPFHIFTTAILTIHRIFSFKEGNFFNREDGYPKKPFPDNWKGKNGVYSVGFTRLGLLGVSNDAQRVAKDIANQWNSELKHLRLARSVACASSQISHEF